MKMEKSSMNKVIILKGSPGVGKTFTARKLVSQLKSKKIAHISIDELLHIDQRKLCEDKLKLAKYNAAVLTRSFLSDKFDIIIEYTFDISEHLKFLIDKIKHSHVDVLPKSDIYIFHIRAKYSEVQKRNKTRKDGSDPLPDNFLEKIYNSCEKNAGKIQNEIIIESDKKSLKQVVEQIMENLK